TPGKNTAASTTDKVVGTVKGPDGQTTAEVTNRTNGPSGKDLVHIKTQGPFYYDTINEKARFDVSEHPGGRPNSVEVIRRTGPQGACDQLDCEHLTLQFQRKSGVNDALAPAQSMADSQTSQL